MSKLIGTNPNQVPSNADLGTAAFMDATDFLTSRGSSLSAVNAVIPKTAVDVFIYDTSKDSDGGAWRKRTKNTSWYNERLNTTTRGSRREFPAVAVIILTNTNVVIYDGDDPTLPMWMEFTIYYSNYSQGSGILGGVYGGANENKTATGIAMMNGQMWMTRLGAYNGAANYGAAVFVDFLQDLGGALGDAFGNGVTVKNPTFLGNIAQRNSSAFSGHGQYKYWSAGIVNDQCKDVAMTVLPNAPIDSATGLPVPTIAVATDGGVSLIKDNGNVFDGNETGAYKTVVFVEDRIVSDRNQGQSRYFISPPVPSISSDGWINADAYIGGWTGSSGYPSTHLDAIPGFMEKAGISFSVKGDNKGLTFWDWKKDTGVNAAFHPTSAVSYVASDYNTGWMQGDIKLATLSDTDATDVTGSELVTNGTFNTDVSGWSNNATEILTWNSSGYAQVDRNGGSSQGQCYQNITTEVGKTYVAKVDVLAVSHGFQVYADQNTIPSTSTSGVVNTTGTFYWWFTASSTTTRIDLSAVQSTTATASFDNVSVKLAESDRSVNNKGLQVFGTVTKNPVATGADLVAYSGFSSSNYLQQPVNTDLHFGSADYCFMGWVKNSVSTQTQAPWELSMGSDGTGDPSILCYLSGGDVTFYTRSTSSSWISLSTPFSTDVWHQIVMVYRNGIKHLYLDGELKGTQAHSGTFSSSDSFFTVGYRGDGAGNPCLFCDISLVRISATAPSAEQIKKIYEDEKVLFQDNAKATLYGSSDAVTALAYDDSTNLLHVGTSSGRSVFQGLKRIDNTTDAVGSAISASNGLVAED